MTAEHNHAPRCCCHLELDQGRCPACPAHAECPSCHTHNDHPHTEYCQLAAELRTPDAWSAELDIRILDADGWRGRNGRPYTDPITRAEFNRRAAVSTVNTRQYPGQPAPQPQPWLGHRDLCPTQWGEPCDCEPTQ